MEPVDTAAEKNAQQSISDFNRSLFLGTLDALEGSKVIVWEQTLMTPFSMVAGATALKQHKVVAMYDLNECSAISLTQHTRVIYIISATFTATKKLIAHLHSIRSVRTEDDRLHHVLFVPEATLALRERLQENRDIAPMLASIDSLRIRVFPLYEDLFTLLMDNTPAKLLLNNDWTELHKCACALRQLEVLAPSLPNIRCKGKWAAQITEMINKMRNNGNEASTLRGRWNISDIVIIDRWCDPLTPMLTQHTYAGLIDEIITFGPSGNLTVTFFPKKDGSEGDTPTTRALRDELFMQLRDLHIRNVGKSIVQTVAEVKDEKKALKEYPSMESMAERKVFVRRVIEAEEKEFNTRIHTAIAEHLMGAVRDDSKMCRFLEVEMNIIRGLYGERVIPFVEELMYDAFQPSRVLRFIALQCLTYGGLRPATYNAYLRLFVQTYGAYETALWIKLQLTGLIYEKQPKIKCNYAPFEFQLCAKRLGCFVESVEDDDKRVSSMYSGYAPILVRHIEMGVSNDWKDWATVSSSDQHSPIDSTSTRGSALLSQMDLREVSDVKEVAFDSDISHKNDYLNRRTDHYSNVSSQDIASLQDENGDDACTSWTDILSFFSHFHSEENRKRRNSRYQEASALKKRRNRLSSLEVSIMRSSTDDNTPKTAPLHKEMDGSFVFRPYSSSCATFKWCCKRCSKKGRKVEYKTEYLLSARLHAIYHISAEHIHERERLLAETEKRNIESEIGVMLKFDVDTQEHNKKLKCFTDEISALSLTDPRLVSAILESKRNAAGNEPNTYVHICFCYKTFHDYKQLCNHLTHEHGIVFRLKRESDGESCREEPIASSNDEHRHLQLVRLKSLSDEHASLRGIAGTNNTNISTLIRLYGGGFCCGTIEARGFCTQRFFWRCSQCSYGEKLLTSEECILRSELAALLSLWAHLKKKHSRCGALADSLWRMVAVENGFPSKPPNLKVTEEKRSSRKESLASIVCFNCGNYPSFYLNDDFSLVVHLLLKHMLCADKQTLRVLVEMRDMESWFPYLSVTHNDYFMDHHTQVLLHCAKCEFKCVHVERLMEHALWHRHIPCFEQLENTLSTATNDPIINHFVVEEPILEDAVLRSSHIQQQRQIVARICRQCYSLIEYPNEMRLMEHYYNTHREQLAEIQALYHRSLTETLDGDLA